MTGLRLTLALLAGRAASIVNRRVGYGGTVLPGHVVPRIDPDALPQIARQLRHGAIMVSGTNGKTTTARLIAHVAAAAGFHPIHNRSGANLMTGLVAAVAGQTDLAGRPRGDLGVFEVDEATLPSAVQAIAPRVLVLANVFRDQLDRYGEVDLVAKTWRSAVAQLAPSTTLILNADDPTVAQLRTATAARVLSFGFEDTSVGGVDLSHDADRRLCPFCSARLDYAWTAYSHLGHYACPACGWSRPRPDVRVTRVCPSADPAKPGTTLTIDTSGETATMRVPLPGLFNAYNALAAAAACAAIGVSLEAIATSMRASEAVFGRFERIPIGDGALTMALVKNPVGFNQVLQVMRTLPVRSDAAPPLMVIAINDLFADGTDVSWLWDVNFEPLAEQPVRVVCAGLRSADMALRLKYAGLSEIETAPSLSTALESATSAARAGQEVLVFPTYTAMLELRRELQRRGHVLPFWED